MKNNKLIIFTVLLILVLKVLGIFDALNDKIYQNYLILNKKNNYSPDIVIIKIDEASINQLGYWPFEHSIYAQLLKKIKNYPIAIGMLISFTDKKRSPNKNYFDKSFYEELKNTNNIVLSTKYDFKNINNLKIAVPKELIYSGITQGHDLINYSKTGDVKSIEPFKKYPAFALLLAKYFYQTKPNKPLVFKDLFTEIDSNKDLYSTNTPILIDYMRTPEAFKQFSFIDVLKDKVNLNEFKNKIVLIGITDKYKASNYVTPFTGNNTKIKSSTAVELQAQILDSLINYRNLKEIPYYLVLIVSLLLTAVFLLLIRHKTVLYQGILFGVFILVTCIIDWFLFKYLAIWFPPAFLISLTTIIFFLSEYLTSSKVDRLLINTVNEYKTDNSLPLESVSPDVISKVTAITNLLELISHDREAIKKIIDSINSGIIVLDTEGKIVWSNTKVNEILEQASLPDNNICNIIEDIKFEKIKSEIYQSKRFKKEIKIKKQDFLCVFNSLNNDNEQYVVVFNDITELKQADRLKSEMVKLVTHEFKTPLTAIKICSENIIFKNESDKSVEYASMIVNATDHLVEMISNFLNLSKLENNMIDFNIERINLINIINKSIELQKPIADSRNIIITLNNNNITEALGDRNLIFIVMNCLISNAIKYSPDNSSIIISLEEILDKIRISVKDFGIGITEDEKEKVFEKFYRATNGKISQIPGIGIGLAITKSILDLHKSKIHLDSEFSKGSTFSFDLDK